MSPDEARKMVQRILDTAPLSVEALAEEAGVTRHAIYSWAAGRRNPTPENLARLADALEKRGGELTDLAKELREAAGE